MLEQIQNTESLIRDPYKQFYRNMFVELFKDSEFGENQLYVAVTVALMIDILNVYKPTTSAKAFAKNWKGWLMGVLPPDVGFVPLRQKHLAEALMVMQRFYMEANGDMLALDDGQ